MSAAWPTLPFDEAVEDASGGNIKTKQIDYADAGEFAIVDQGKALIAGYTDDEAALCKAPLPVVIFGDHTRCLKFVDFPFGMGADGVKVLKPKAGLDAKFLYHYLRQIKLPDGGYDRHFKYLKRETVPLPPLEEQRRIAAILDQAETLRTQRRTALALLDSLTQSLFLDLLEYAGGDVEKVAVEDAMDAIIDYRGKTPEKTTQGVPLVTAKVVKNGELLEPDEFIAEDAYDDWMQRGFPEAGDVLFTTEAPLGEVAQLDGRKVALAQRLLVLRGKHGLLQNTFLRFALTSWEVRRQIETRATGSTVKGIRQKELRQVELPIPPFALQHTFAARIASIEALKVTHRRALATLDALFASLQQRAFAGAL